MPFIFLLYLKFVLSDSLIKLPKHFVDLCWPKHPKCSAIFFLCGMFLVKIRLEFCIKYYHLLLNYLS